MKRPHPWLLLLPLLLLLLPACAFEDALPPGATVRCSGEADCPPGYACPVTLGRCIPQGEDLRAPSASAAVVDPQFARAGAVVRVSFQVDEELGVPALVTGAGPEVIAFIEAGTAGLQLEHETTVQEATLEGTYAVRTRLVDASGNLADALPLGSFVVDRTPPGVVDGSLRFGVEPTTAPSPVGALGPGGVLVSEALIDEPLASTPVVRSVPEGLVVRDVALDGQLLQVRLEVDAASPLTGVVDVVADLEDRAGNTTTSVLGRVEVDTAVPAPPDPDQACLKLVRRPWGADETGGASFPTLVLAPGCEMPEQRGTVLVFDEDDGLLLESRAVTDGRFADIDIAVADAPTVVLRFVDDAGNVSSAAAVRDVEWVATLGGKVLGSPFPNPHRVSTRQVHAASLVQAGTIEKPAGTIELPDGAVLRAEGAASWVERTLRGPTAGLLASYDGGRGRVLGTSDAGIFEFTGQRWVEMNVEDLEGDGSPVDLGLSGAAWDERKDRMIVFAGGGAIQDETWAWDGRSFRRIGTQASCVPPTPRFGAVLEWHPVLERVVLIAGTVFGGDDPALMLADDDCWVPMPGDPSLITRRIGPAVARDDARGRLVLFSGGDGAGTFTDTWVHDGSSWRELEITGPPSGFLPGLAADPQQPTRLLATAGGQVWTLEDETWSYLPQPAHIEQDLAGRSLATLIVDGARDRVMLISGGGDTREWNGDTFVTVDRAPLPHTVKVDRVGAAAVESSLGLFVLNVGPLDSASSVLWQGIEWVDAGAAPTPDRRYGMAAPDGVSFVLFGGDDVVAVNGTTMIYEDDAWVDSLATGPAARCCGSIAYDAIRERVVLFGGFGGAPGGLRPLLGDTWEWSGADEQWVQPVETDDEGDGSPPPRHQGAMAFDPISGEVLLTGGNGEIFTVFDDTWLWNGTRWRNVTPALAADRAQRPAARLVEDPQTGLLTLFGSDTTDVGSVLQWDGAAWRRREGVDTSGHGLPLVRVAPLLAREPFEPRITMTGGAVGTLFGEVPVEDGVWTWDGGATTHPSILVEIDLGAALIPDTATVDRIQVNATAAASSDVGGGARLSWWQGGAWRPLATHTAPGIEGLEADVGDPDIIRAVRTHREGRAFLLVEPLGDNGVEGATVDLDSVELRVSYRR